MRAHLASGSEFHKKALESLLQDCMKKRSATAKDLAVKRALKRPRADEDEADEEDGEPEYCCGFLDHRLGWPESQK